MINDSLFDKTLDKINKNSEKYKNVFPLLLVLPTLIGGLWQILELIFIDPSFIRFFSVTQLISDGILILTIFIIFAIYLNLLDKHFDFKDLVKFDLLKQKFSLSQFGASIMLILCSLGYYYKAFDNLSFDNLEVSRMGKILINLLAAGVFLPLLVKGILLFSHEFCLLLFFRSRELKVQHIRKFRNQKGIIYYLSHFVSIILMISIITFIVISIIVLIQFRNKTIYPQNLENLKNIFKQVHKEFGDKQKSSILYFNDKYIFIELDNEKLNNEKPSHIKIYKTDDILFKNEK